MNPRFPNPRTRASGWAAAAVLALATLGPDQIHAQDKFLSDLPDQLARTGIFFRADTPWALRNADDPWLPLYLEIINGVERTAHTTGATVSQVLKRDPLPLEGVNVFIKPSGERRQFADDPLPLGQSKDFSFDARTNAHPLSIPDRWRKTLEIPLERIETYLGRHFIGGPWDEVDLRVAFRLAGWPSQETFLRARLHAPPLPAIPNWYRGDAHYHSSYTDNPAERGYPLSVTKQAALDSGLNWVALTDHSTDLSPDQYARQLGEVTSLRDGRFLFIRGEELTVASNQDTLLPTLHLLALPSPDDPDKGFPDTAGGSSTVILTGDGSLASPALPLKEALARIAASGGFAFAAHPFDPVSPLIRGGTWNLDLDFLAPGGRALQAGLAGLELWNRATTATADDARDPFCLHRQADPSGCFQPDKDADQYARLEKGIDLGWRPLLLKGIANEGDATQVFLVSGSDAHGDFNYEATFDVVDFVGKPSRGLSGYAEDNALGKLSTVVYCPTGMGRRGGDVLRALRQGRSVLSNGPLVIAGFDVDSNGSLEDAADIGIGQEISSSLDKLPPLQISWVSSPEFGPILSLRLVLGSKDGESNAEEIALPPTMALSSQGLFALDLRARLGNRAGRRLYIRLEARTRNSAGEEFRCYTNPIGVQLPE